MENRLEAGPNFNEMCFTLATDGKDQPAVAFSQRFLEFPSPNAPAIVICLSIHLLDFTRGRDKDKFAICSRGCLS